MLSTNPARRTVSNPAPTPAPVRDTEEPESAITLRAYAIESRFGYWRGHLPTL